MFCVVEDCEREDIQGRGLCHMHYMRLRRGQELNSPKRTGGFVKYQMAHLRVKAERGPARGFQCAECGSQAKEWSYDGSDSDQLYDIVMGYRMSYSLRTECYRPLCAKCHRNEDIDRRGGRAPSCSIDGCEKKHHGNGLCNTHWKSDYLKRKKAMQ